VEGAGARSEVAAEADGPVADLCDYYRYTHGIAIRQVEAESPVH
jgi:hypothetical protein